MKRSCLKAPTPPSASQPATPTLPTPPEPASGPSSVDGSALGDILASAKHRPPPLCDKHVSFCPSTEEKVFVADEWDRTPTEACRKLSYADILELKQMHATLPRAEQAPETAAYMPRFLKSVPIHLLPLLPAKEPPKMTSARDMFKTSPSASPPPPSPLALANAANASSPFGRSAGRSPLAGSPLSSRNTSPHGTRIRSARDMFAKPSANGQTPSPPTTPPVVSPKFPPRRQLMNFLPLLPPVESAPIPAPAMVSVPSKRPLMNFVPLLPPADPEPVPVQTPAPLTLLMPIPLTIPPAEPPSAPAHPVSVPDADAQPQDLAQPLTHQSQPILTAQSKTHGDIINADIETEADVNHTIKHADPALVAAYELHSSSATSSSLPTPTSTPALTTRSLDDDGLSSMPTTPSSPGGGIAHLDQTQSGETLLPESVNATSTAATASGPTAFDAEDQAGDEAQESHQAQAPHFEAVSHVSGLGSVLAPTSTSTSIAGSDSAVTLSSASTAAMMMSMPHPQPLHQSTYQSQSPQRRRVPESLQAHLDKFPEPPTALPEPTPTSDKTTFDSVESSSSSSALESAPSARPSNPPSPGALSKRLANLVSENSHPSLNGNSGHNSSSGSNSAAFTPSGMSDYSNATSSSYNYNSSSNSNVSSTVSSSGASTYEAHGVSYFGLPLRAARGQSGQAPTAGLHPDASTHVNGSGHSNSKLPLHMRKMSGAALPESPFLDPMMPPRSGMAVGKAPSSHGALGAHPSHPSHPPAAQFMELKELKARGPQMMQMQLSMQAKQAHGPPLLPLALPSKALKGLRLEALPSPMLVPPSPLMLGDSGRGDGRAMSIDPVRVPLPPPVSMEGNL